MFFDWCEEKRIVFLIGAGGSSPFIKDLTTKYLTDAILDPNKWKNIIFKFKEKAKSGSYLRNIEECDVMQVIFKIKCLLNSSSYSQNLNFEYIIHLLDKVSVYYLSHDLSEISNIDTLLLSFFTKYQNPYRNNLAYFDLSHPDGWKYVPVLAREIIVDAILELWKPESCEIKEAKSIIRDFFCKKIKSTFKYINIYTLNYDPLLYESLKDCYDDSTKCDFKTGFELLTEDRKKFVRDVFINSNRTLAFLHGYVGFIPTQSIGDLEFSDNYMDAQEERLKRFVDEDMNWTNSVSKGLHYNVYITTGLDKIDTFSVNPFASYIHKFAIDISKADFIVIIGTSFTDNHINTFLVNSTAFTRGKIIIVTKNKEELDIVTKNKEELEKIYDILFMTRESLKLPDFERIKIEFENGKEFVKLSNNIAIFQKGTEEFYKKEYNYLKNVVFGLWK